MRKTMLILVVAVAVASMFASCTTSRGMYSSRGGCKMNQGFVGYGSAR